MLPFDEFNDYQVMFQVIKGARPPRSPEITLSRGLNDRMWTRMLHWWHDSPTKRPDLCLTSHDAALLSRLSLNDT
jgi:hypothetical protein